MLEKATSPPGDIFSHAAGVRAAEAGRGRCSRGEVRGEQVIFFDVVVVVFLLGAGSSGGGGGSLSREDVRVVFGLTFVCVQGEEAISE